VVRRFADAAATVTPAQLKGPDGLGWLHAFVDPTVVVDWSLRDWDRVVRLARRHRLLARLDARIEQAGLADGVPPDVRKHLLGARRLSQARTRAMLWAIERLPGMLDNPAYPLVLLKGAAYLGQGLPIADGRLPSDLDILLPKQKLPEVRFRLKVAGWHEPPLDDHDQRYYLEWSHELPPMQHNRHAIELDVHHNILPPRAGKMVDAALLFADLRPSQWPDWQVIAPVDQVLHSASHLFFDAEPRDRVRDLVDLDGLFRYFGVGSAFWVDLPRRAEALGLLEPLALACHFTQRWFDTPIPADLQATLARLGPGRIKQYALVALMGAVLMPGAVDRPDGIEKRLAATTALARYHAHRLPWRVLLPHLWRKWRASAKRSTAADAAAGPAA
jgi:Uncharacterised nucleotidyltransferase